MLQQLSIKNVALIEDMTLDFGKGFHVLSGETGAGKSIVIDSLNLVFGERADKEFVRTGCNRARVEGIFSITDTPGLQELLEENGIDCEEDMLIILREISLDGKSICRINGNAVTLSLLKKVADFLADIHGQHEHQLLLNVDRHLGFLDAFGGEELLRQKENVRQAYTYYKACTDKLNGDWGSEEERSRRIEMLEYQIGEIENASIEPGEEEELRTRAEFLRHADRIRSELADSRQAIEADALDQIRSAMNSLARIADMSEVYASLAARLDSAYYELEDVAQELGNQAEQVDADPYEIERIEDRLAELKKLFRKYGADEDTVLAYLDEATAELDRLVNAEQTIAELSAQAERFKQEYLQQARKLSEIRHDTAIAFEDRIKEELTQLGMKNANLEVSFDEAEGYSPDGIDKVEFLFSANAGEPLKPLNKIISGGEMSRFMLAMKSVAADDAMLPTMVFDEIDTGISGQGALVVAQKMAKLSKKHQVIAVTHLPQLASMADCHYLVQKVTENDRTYTLVSQLEYEQRLKEIARLAGGSETALALQRAGEILAEADAFKQCL